MGRIDLSRGSVSKLEHEVAQFQSRPVRDRLDIPIQFPETVYAFGTPKHVMYYSDKRDPNDPEGEGRQGVWKQFIHKHTGGFGLKVYRMRPPGGSAKRAKPVHVMWPEAMGWLGDFTELMLKDGKTINKKRGTWGLFMVPDTRAIVALPYKNAKPSDIIIWRGGLLNVTWRGIEH